MNKFFGIFGAVALLALPACTPVTAALGVGAAAGVAAAQEGGIKTAVTDKSIYLKINDLWLRDNVEMFRKLNLTVKEGRVLIAGSVPYPDQRVRAVQLAWQAEGVRQVINEIQVDSEGGGVTDYIKDTWISGNIKTRMTFDRDIQSINYTIDTVNGTVYIMGVAQDQGELNRVLHTARTTKYVKNVVSYARMRGETPPGVQTPTGATNASSSSSAAPAPYRDMAPAAGNSGTYAPPQPSYAPAPSYQDGGAYGGRATPAPVQAESLGAPH